MTALANGYHLQQFLTALLLGDETSASALVADGQVDSNATVPRGWVKRWHDDKQNPLVFLAIAFERFEVVSTLACHKANMSSFHRDPECSGVTGRIEEQNCIGFAIQCSTLSMVKIIRDLGGNMEEAWRVRDAESCEGPFGSDGFTYNALEVAIRFCKMECVTWLLEEVGMRAWLIDVETSSQINYLFEQLLFFGDRCIPLLDLLVEQGFKFRELEARHATMPRAELDDFSLSELVIRFATLSGSRNLPKYLMRKFGVTIRLDRRDELQIHDDELFEHLSAALMEDRRNGICNDTVLNEKAIAEINETRFKCYSYLKKNSCASCSIISASKMCTGCQKTRYCSRECQRAHWKSEHRDQCVSTQCTKSEKSVVL